ncbi:phospholipase A1-Igamma1, chloroplastic-like [Magnolia sinica]|uniref:phospholipase A1-Igamma1, chloroplastic-like n=1 Tax=Magnolia sinica TaxID=86752 RepID=UPI002658D7DB|nr:phospholipase A1-Igamma1, chloroplastic-like [Magnolia sinica]
MYNSTTPTSSTMEDGHAKWREIHSPSGWPRLIHDDQPDPWLKQEIIRYGVFSHATVMAFKFDSSSESFPNHLGLLFEQLHRRYGYEMTKLIYAHIDWPSCIGKLLSSWMGKWDGKQKNDSNLIGYVAVSDDDMSHQIGRRDIVVAWRGSVKLGEWFKDLQVMLKKTGTGKVRVARGFNSIYTFKSDSSNLSASEEVMGEVKTLMKLYKDKGEEVGLTITGHSLGGALALLNAYEVASSLPDLPISVISFGAPRVGNIAFRDELNKMDVKTLRVVNKSDKVTMLPGLTSKERIERKFKKNLSTDKLVKIVGLKNRVYKHVGTELMLDATRRLTPCEAHELKTYLSLLNGSDSVGFKIPCACSPECYVG